MVDLVEDFLVLCEHVVLDYLFAQDVKDFVIVDAVGRGGDLEVLGEAEAALEGEFNAVEEDSARLIEHWFTFLD